MSFDNIVITQHLHLFFTSKNKKLKQQKISTIFFVIENTTVPPFYLLFFIIFNSIIIELFEFILIIVFRACFGLFSDVFCHRVESSLFFFWFTLFCRAKNVVRNDDSSRINVVESCISMF
jgi:hypothetical protein